MPVSQMASNKGVFRGNLDGDLLDKLEKKSQGQLSRMAEGAAGGWAFRASQNIVLGCIPIRFGIAGFGPSSIIRVL